MTNKDDMLEIPESLDRRLHSFEEDDDGEVEINAKDLIAEINGGDEDEDEDDHFHEYFQEDEEDEEDEEDPKPEPVKQKPTKQKKETAPAMAPGRGHNSGIAGERLRSFVERIERLEEEKTNLGSDIKEVYSELKGSGFDAKIVKKIVGLRKKSEEDRQMEEELLQVYMSAMGM